MKTSVQITTAPACWGVDDVTNPHLPRWERVLDEAQAAGFGGLELGPYGYMPLDAERLSEALQARGLMIVAGTIFDDLVDPANRDRLLKQAADICGLLARLPRPDRQPGQRFDAPYLTVMDWGHDERDFAAGHPERAPRLEPEAWRGMMDTIRDIATLARDEYGVRATVHPHAGGYIEFADELERLVEDMPAEVAGLCLDTGHTAYAGMDPVATLRRYGERVDYIHFKDISAETRARVMGHQIRFFDACARGLMTPIGRGCLDYPAICATISELGYGGYVTIEQERDPRNGGSVLTDLIASREYLMSIGFQGRDG